MLSIQQIDYNRPLPALCRGKRPLQHQLNRCNNDKQLLLWGPILDQSVSQWGNPLNVLTSLYTEHKVSPYRGNVTWYHAKKHGFPDLFGSKISSPDRLQPHPASPLGVVKRKLVHNCSKVFTSTFDWTSSFNCSYIAPLICLLIIVYTKWVLCLCRKLNTFLHGLYSQNNLN